MRWEGHSPLRRIVKSPGLTKTSKSYAVPYSRFASGDSVQDDLKLIEFDSARGWSDPVGRNDDR